VSTANAVFNNQIANDNLTVSSTGSFSDKNAANGKTVTLTNILGGADLGNYTITDQTTTTANINKKDVSLASVTAASKTYDGNDSTNITAGNVTGTVAGEALSVTGSGHFSDKNVATGKTVTVADVTALTKANGTGDWSNYNLTTTGAITTTAEISAKAITLTGITAANKVYDGSNSATISTNGAVFNNQISGDNLTVSSTGTFSDKNAADGITAWAVLI
jgi:hypothetical protein